MNELYIAALNKAIQVGRCWQVFILCPNVDGCGEYNLLDKEVQKFRKTKCGGKAGCRVSGIWIPTLIPAVVGGAGECKNRDFHVGMEGGFQYHFQTSSKYKTFQSS